MPKEIYKITYNNAADGVGCIELDTTVENFEETLRKVEQTLADSHASNIVYTHYFVEDEE